MDVWMDKGDEVAVLFLGTRWQQRRPLLRICPQSFCELLAMKMNDWEQIRLFLGDLHLAHYERGKRATWLIGRDGKKKKITQPKTQKQDKWQRAESAVVFFCKSEWMVMDMKGTTGSQDGVEASVSDLNNIKFLDHWERQGKMRLHVVVVMSHTPTHTQQKAFWVSKCCVGKRVDGSRQGDGSVKLARITVMQQDSVVMGRQL